MSTTNVLKQLNAWANASRPGGRKSRPRVGVSASTASVLSAMRNGSVLHLEYDSDKGEKIYWLTSPWKRVRRDVAERVLAEPHIVPQDDRLFDQLPPQSWLHRTSCKP